MDKMTMAASTPASSKRVLSEEKADFEITCMSCGKTSSINIVKKELLAYMAGTPIQRAMPKASICKRERIISRLCGSCYEEIFNYPCDETVANSPDKDNIEGWGKFAGNCPVCDCAIWTERNATDNENEFVCRSCGSKSILNDDILVEE